MIIIRLSFLLFLASLPVFLGVEVMLRLAVPHLATHMMQLGSALLLSAYSLLLLTGLLAVCSAILHSIAHYFSSRQRVQRRMLFLQAKQEQLKQLFHFRTLQMQYANELKRGCLLKANNRKHSRALASSIHKELLLIEKYVSSTTFRLLQQELACCRSQQDVDALLKLQQRIESLASATRHDGFQKLAL